MLKKEDMPKIGARALTKQESALYLASRTGLTFEKALAAIERREQRHFEAAVAAMQVSMRENYAHLSYEDVAADAVRYAEALMAELDKVLDA